MRICIIACISKNYALGYQNRLIYHIKKDMKRFKELTCGHTILMGRKTFESLPNGPLEKRRNIVLSKQPITPNGCEVAHSIEEAISKCDMTEEVFVIGGEQVYTAMLPFADHLYLTVVDDIPVKADTYFPEIKESEWTIEQLTESTEGKLKLLYIHYKRTNTSPEKQQKSPLSCGKIHFINQK